MRLSEFEQQTIKTVTTCSRYAEKLKWSKAALAPIFPLTQEKLKNLTHEEDGQIEAFMSRFGKLQDMMGAVLFTKLLEKFGEPSAEKLFFIDRLNKLEKLEVISSKQEWNDLRELRNLFADEYPDIQELQVNDLNKAYAAIDRLLIFWEKVKQHIPQEWF
jgi:hypothetical protein